MSREYSYDQGHAQEPMAWERVEWRQGDGRYVFEVARGGLLATLSSPHGAKLTLPMVAWEGLLDALAAARKTKARAERNLPARTGARWSETETQELAKTFKAGGSIAQLARVHNRTQFAVEAQLERQGLWDRAERRPTERTRGGHLPPGESGSEGRPTASSAMDADRVPASAPVVTAHHDAPQRSPHGPIGRPWSPDAAPAADRRPGPGQQPSFGATEARGQPTFAPARGRRGADGAPFTGSEPRAEPGASVATDLGADRD